MDVGEKASVVVARIEEMRAAIGNFMAVVV
jgi:hypothetical protein